MLLPSSLLPILFNSHAEHCLYTQMIATNKYNYLCKMSVCLDGHKRSSGQTVYAFETVFHLQAVCCLTHPSCSQNLSTQTSTTHKERGRILNGTNRGRNIYFREVKYLRREMTKTRWPKEKLRLAPLRWKKEIYFTRIDPTNKLPIDGCTLLTIHRDGSLDGNFGVRERYHTSSRFILSNAHTHYVLLH